MKRGFTLIEFLVSMAIVCLLSSILVYTISGAAARARDTKKISEANSVKTAAFQYFTDHGTMPPQFDCSSGHCIPTQVRISAEVEDLNNPINPSSEEGMAFHQTMLTLMSGGYLTTIPHSDDRLPYQYIDYGPKSAQGMVFSSQLNVTSPDQYTEPKCRLETGTCYIDTSTPIGLDSITHQPIKGTRYCVYPNPHPQTNQLASCFYVTSLKDNSLLLYDDSPGCYQPPSCLPGTSEFCACSPY